MFFEVGRVHLVREDTLSVLLAHCAFDLVEVRMQSLVDFAGHLLVWHHLDKEVFVAREVIRVAHLLGCQRAKRRELVRHFLLALVNDLALHILAEAHLLHELVVGHFI